MSYDYLGIIILLFLFFTSVNSCWNTIINNVTFGHIENPNFFLGESQKGNNPCSWFIHNHDDRIHSYYIVSLRILKSEINQTLYPHELILKHDKTEILINNINQRTFYIPSSNLEVLFRPKLHSNSLNIQRFLLEFAHINSSNYNQDGYFHCSESDIIIPNQWKCNCLHECIYDDHSDEDNCPLCPTVRTPNSLLCRSDETWCLPQANSIDKIDSNGVCIPHDQTAQCSYSSKCETIISYSKDHGEILLDNSILSNRETLCFVIIAKEKHRIKLIVNQFDFINQRPDLELLIYDGSEKQNQLLLSSDMMLMRQIIQTHETHIATIVIRKRSVENRVFFNQQYDNKNILFNVTWFTTLCPSNQMLCSGHYEIKCYSPQQRCDGIWDCISGEDESGCSRASCPNSFACNDPIRLPSDQPRCYTWFERCNGNPYCGSRIDEQNCTKWWCNSNNGTFLCNNLNCIYETWVCDGSNDCGDNSDEINCPFRISRRIMASAVIGASLCSILFILALGCTCKLLNLRAAEQRASMRLLNPQEYIQRRREELQRQSNQNPQPTNDDDDPLILLNSTPRVAPPSYNQSIGVTDEDEERHALLSEYLRLAGLDHFISLPLTNSSSRATRHRNRRHRRHRRRHHHHHRNQNEESRILLLDSNTAETHPPLSVSSTNRFDRFRSRFRSLFIRNLSINNNRISSNDFDIQERNNSIQPIALSNRTCFESQELPPAYADEPLLNLHNDNEIQSSTNISTTTPSTIFRIRKRHLPLNSLCDHLEDQSSTSPSSLPITTMQEDEQASSDDDKILMP